jgi:hypothetical protein
MSADRDDGDGRDRMPMLPGDFWDWPREARIDWMALNEHRRGLITKLFLEAGIDVEDGIKREHYLTEKELAAIYCRLLEVKS